MNARDLLKRLGPGFITGTSDDDPAGIGTSVQAGAQFGYGMLWTALFTFPIMAAVQEMCGRIGLVTGGGLAPLIRRHYAPQIVFFLIGIQVVTNTINIGADLSAMAQSTQLLWHVSYWALLALTTTVMVALITFVPYRQYSTILKFLGMLLLSYVVGAFTVHADWPRLLRDTFIPQLHWSAPYVLTLIAVLGVTISPYEFFWQASEEVEELVDEGKIKAADTKRPRITESDIGYLRWDTAFGMFFSIAISFFVMVTAAATLHSSGHTDIQSAKQAAEVLRPLAGPSAFVLFTLGIIGSGLLSIPVMSASSAYALCGTFKWRGSLADPFWRGRRFYAIIAVSCIVGLAVNLLHVQPFKLLYYSGVLNGMISPFLLFIVTHVAGSKRIMGKHANRWWSNLFGYAMAGVMAVALVAFFILNRS